MGIFQSLNRRFEADLILDIRVQLKQAHGVESKYLEIRCHAGRGSYHGAVQVPIAADIYVQFHYCGGMGYTRLLDEGEWQQASWMCVTKNQAAQRIADFCSVMEVATSAIPVDDSHFAGHDILEHLSPDENEDEDEDEDVEGPTYGTYDFLVNHMNGTGFSKFKPFVTDAVGEGMKEGSICLELLGDDPDFLLIGKANDRLGWDGKWKAALVKSTPSGRIKIQALEWGVSVSKTLPDEVQIEKLFTALASFVADITKLDVSDVYEIGSALKGFPAEDEDEDFELYGDALGIYGQVADQLRFKDFSGTNLNIVSNLVGVTNTPALLFNVPFGVERVIGIYKKNALTWVAAAFTYTAQGELMFKSVPWEVRHSEDADYLATEVAILAHRLTFGDLTERL